MRLRPGAWLFLEGSPSTAGSLAIPVRDPIVGGDRLLTAAHVAGALNADRVKVSRVHTNELGATHTGSVHIGHAGRSCPDDPDEEWITLNCPVDAVLIEPLPGVEASRDLAEGITAHGDYYEDPLDPSLLELRVFKVGAQSGLTSGLITQIGASFTATHRRGQIQYPLGFLIMSDTDARPFALPGDSGSAVVDERGCLVGLIVAMQPASRDPSTLAFAIPIASVIRELGIQLIGGAWQG